jgi:hypothetical protein
MKNFILVLFGLILIANSILIYKLNERQNTFIVLIKELFEISDENQNMLEKRIEKIEKRR